MTENQTTEPTIDFVWPENGNIDPEITIILKEILSLESGDGPIIDDDASESERKGGEDIVRALNEVLAAFQPFQNEWTLSAFGDFNHYANSLLATHAVCAILLNSMADAIELEGWMRRRRMTSEEIRAMRQKAIEKAAALNQHSNDLQRYVAERDAKEAAK